ncbi:DNA translocase FtsK, partial [bacterium]|nr:DNA translocase FtsK [bacterium]
ALLIISLLIMFNISLNELIDKFKKVFLKIKLFIEKSRTKREEIKEDKIFTKQKEIYQKEEVSEEEKPESIVKETISILTKKEKKYPKKDFYFPLKFLKDLNEKSVTKGDIEANKIIIKRTLANFGIEVEMGEAKVGPTVTQYTLRPAEGIKLSQITSLHNDLALALAAHPIRIEAPIPGKSLVGIEVPNQGVAVVSLKEILVSQEFKYRKSNLTVCLGKDVAGKSWVADLDEAPHLLVAGATGSGKTVCLNSIILSLIYQNSPNDLKFILVDPKRVELVAYDGIPYLLTPVVTSVEKTINALKWAILEMEKRFEKLSQSGKRDIRAYNQNQEEKMPYIIIVIDELADLMATAGLEVEACIIRLAQMARAVGIHLVMATQRPSVNIITGLIKANITSRIALSVASSVDSRTILDVAGAEKLLGRGDMLYISAKLSKPKRLQGAYVSDKEIGEIVNYLKTEEPEYIEEVTEKKISPVDHFPFSKSDELLPQAKEIVIRAKKASASLLQRRLRIGYARAARLLDLLEEQGIIGPPDGAKPRKILVGEEELSDKYGEENEE